MSDGKVLISSSRWNVQLRGSLVAICIASGKTIFSGEVITQTLTK